MTGQGEARFSGAGATVTANYLMAARATINAGSLSVSAGTLTANNLALNGGSLSGAGAVSINGAMGWTGGTLSIGTTVTGGSTLAISGGGDKGLAGTLNNAGAAVWSGGRIFANTGTINNQAGGSFEVQCDQPFYDGTFNNAGAFSKTTTGGTTGFHASAAAAARFHNSGSVSLQSGILDLNGSGTHSGLFDLANGMLLNFTGGSHVFNAGQMTGQGEARFSGAGATVTANYLMAARATINAGSLSVSAGTLTANNLALNGGSLSGAGAVSINGAMGWTGGTLSIGTTVTGGSTLAISGGGDKGLAGTLNNAGAAVWSGGRIFANTGTINNQAGGSFEVQCDQPFYDGTFNNAGAFSKTTTGGTTGFHASAAAAARFHNSGSVSLQSGILDLNGSGTHSGLFDLANGTLLNFTGGSHVFNAGQMTGQGEARFSGAGATVTANYLMAARATINAGSLTVSAGTLTANNLGFNGGSLSGAGAVSINGAMGWTGGTLSIGTTVTGGSTLAISGGGDKGLAGTLNNAGAAVWSGGRIFANTGTINNQAGGSFEVQCDQPFYDGTFNNAGAFSKTTTGGTTGFHASAAAAARFHNSGSVSLQSGILDLNGSGTHSGLFDLANGMLLNFTGGSHVFNAGQMTGQGEARFSGAGATVTANYLMAARATINAGSLSVSAGTLTANNLALNGGSLSGAGAVSINGAMGWTGGTLSIGTTVTGGSTLAISGGGDKGLAGTLNNAGAAVWSGGRIFANTGTINNQAGGSFEVQCDQPFYDGTFNNAGAFSKTTTGGTTGFHASAAAAARFHNSGSVSLVLGVLQLNGNGTHSGSFDLTAGTTLTLAAGGHSMNNVIFGGGGTVECKTGLTLASDINFNTVNAVFEGSASVAGNFVIANTSGGTITMVKSMTIPGSMHIAGTLINGAGLTLTLNGTLTLEATGLLDNPGTVRVTAFVNTGGTVTGNAPVIVTPSLQDLRISQIKIATGNRLAASYNSAEVAGRDLILIWNGPADASFVVETSSDCDAWLARPATIEQTEPGTYQARIRSQAEGIQFFRLRLASPTAVAE